jgi:hypothetical protein
MDPALPSQHFDGGPGSGVTPACIHNNYPDVVETIRNKMGRTGRSPRAELKRLAGAIRLLCQRLKAAEREVVRIASENARLVSENAALSAQLQARNVVSLRRQSESRTALTRRI